MAQQPCPAPATARSHAWDRMGGSNQGVGNSHTDESLSQPGSETALQKECEGIHAYEITATTFKNNLVVHSRDIEDLNHVLVLMLRNNHHSISMFFGKLRCYLSEKLAASWYGFF